MSEETKPKLRIAHTKAIAVALVVMTIGGFGLYWITRPASIPKGYGVLEGHRRGEALPSLPPGGDALPSGMEDTKVDFKPDILPGRLVVRESALFHPGSGKIVASTTTGKSGKFRFVVKPGDYEIVSDKAENQPGSCWLQYEVTEVSAGVVTHVDVSCQPE